MKNLLLKYFFLLLALGGAGCVLGLYIAPVHSLKLTSAVALFSLLLAALAAWIRHSQTARERLSASLDDISAQPFLFRLLAGMCALVFMGGWLHFFLPISRATGQLNLYLLTQPLAAWLMVSALEIGLALFLWRGLRWPLSDEWKTILKTGGIVLATLLLLWGFIAVTRLGLDPVGVFWYAPGTPLLLVQVLFAWALGILFLFTETRWNRRSPKSGLRLDILATALIWALACLLWISTPVTRPTIFQPAPVAPNYEPYPFSDSAKYDANAQSFLVGEGFSLDPSLKPLYSLFLAFLHLLAGQDYATIANLQILLLAFIPVFVYALGVLLSNRPAGLIAAILFILREKNSIELANIIQVSHAKLLLSDLPATGLMIALMVFLVGWLLKPETRRLWPLAAGGALGMSLVLRTQVVVVIPFILLGAALAFYQNRRAILAQSTLLMLVGVLVSTLPWVGYGYFANAQLKSPDYLHLLALQFRSGPPEELKQRPGETTQEFEARIQRQVTQYALKNPGQIAQSMAAYFFRNAVQSVTFLPLSPMLETDVASYAERLPFWDNWRGALPDESRVMLACNLALLALGSAALRARARHAALLLLLVFVGYITSLALPMLSGWRFLLPADWIVVFTLAVGLMELSLLGRSLFGTQPDPYPTPVTPAVSPAATPSPLSWPRLALLTLSFALINLSLPVAQAVIPVRYPPQTDAQFLASYAEKMTHITVANLVDAATLTDFLKQKNAVALYGRALYPRFFAAGSGLRSTGWPNFLARDYNRLSFYVVGPLTTGIVLPTEQSPTVFPHAADVRVFGCLRDPEINNRRFVQAWVVVVHADTDIFLRSSGPTPNCVQ